MEFKITTVLHRFIIVLALILFNAGSSVFAQSISVPRTFSPVACGADPNTSVEYTGSICLSDCYYQNAAVVFTYSGFSGGNFNVELSNSSGSFATPTVLNASPIAIASSPGRIPFNWPTNLAGEGYKLRVKCISPAITGPGSAAGFPAYFMSFNSNFHINGNLASASICGGGSFTLSIDNPTPSIPSSSPANYPGLVYIWKRDGVVIPGETGTSINITTGGVYRVEINYGTCTTISSITHSQPITINVVSGGSTFTINSSEGTNICSTPTILSTQQGYVYQWYKDNVLIPSATAYNYVTAQPGAYHVVVNQGGCSSTSNTITLTGDDFNASINLPPTSFIIPGETVDVTVTTDATDPTYQWYSGSPLAPISGETNSTYTADTPGNYKVVINQTSGCLLSKEILFTLKAGTPAVKIPNVISPNSDEINDFWEIPQEYISPTTEVIIMNSVGEIVLQTMNYNNRWPESPIDFKLVNPVYYYIITKEGSEAKKGSITVIK